MNVKLSDSQLNELNQTGVTLRMNIKKFQGNNSPDELLLTARQKAKLRNAFEKNLSTIIKFYKLMYLK